MALHKLHAHLLLLAAVFGVLFACSFHSALSAPSSLWKQLISGVLAACFLPLSVWCLWAVGQKPNPRQSLGTLALHFVLASAIRLRGWNNHGLLKSFLKDPMAPQHALWRKIRAENGATAYGKEHSLQEMELLQDLRKRHPLTGYDHFRPYVDRMIEGERDVLVSGLPHSYIRTTGTTGKSKYIPIKKKSSQLADILVIWIYVGNQTYPSSLLGKYMYFFVAPKILKTKNGTSIETAATMPQDKDWILAPFSAPPAGYKISSLHEAVYVQLLFGLLDPDLSVMLVGFCHFLESAMKILEKHWKDFVEDVAKATLRADLDLPADIRDSLTRELKRYGGNPERAAQLKAEFEKGFQGILKRIWPKLPYILGIDSTGSWPRLRQTYADGVELLTPGYGCSEGSIGLSLGRKYMAKGYIPTVQYMIYEFIKEEEMDQPKPQAYFLNEVERDQNYEIVITQPYGLYRYRMGDVIRVVGFLGDMPVIDFLYRTGQMLNLRYEKLDQRVVLDSLRAAAAQWPGKTLLEFAAAESTILTQESPAFDPKELMPYYLFFLELKEGSVKDLSEEEKKTIDDELRERNSDYERLRREGSISAARVRLVRPGAFSELQAWLFANTGATANQYKVPRKLRTYAMVDVMLKNLAA